MIEQADLRRWKARQTITSADVSRGKKELEEAEDEMRGRLNEIGRQGMDITRRLDYTYYNLLEKVDALVGTIKGFQEVSEQSEALMRNFENESERLDKEVKRKIEQARKGFEERDARAKDLEEKGREAATKAAGLSRRLENARVVLDNWEKREKEKERVSRRLWGTACTAMAVVICFVVAVLLWEEWWFRGDPVKAGLNLPDVGSTNTSLELGPGTTEDSVLRHANLPEDVRAVLEGIEQRNGERKTILSEQLSEVEVPKEERDNEEKHMRVFDEL